MSGLVARGPCGRNRDVARGDPARWYTGAVAATPDEILLTLAQRGVEIVDPRQTYVAPEIEPDRVCAGAILHPGARLCGARTFIGPGAQVGAEGPATVVNGVLGRDARIDAGYLDSAVLLDGARVGWGAHLRPGTLLEEGASTAHCVGLKHTILLSFVTVGSVVNLCDLLMAGGTSAADHSEVGSGFIHFNFTPWGIRGDKATASLVGDVVQGVFLRQRRIFLGGAGGMVGPRRVGFGAIAGAGQVVRRDVDAGQLSVQLPRAVDRTIAPGYLDAAGFRQGRNVEYIAQVVALREWYRQVRRAHATGPAAIVVDAAIQVLGLCVAERVKRLEAFVRERDVAMPPLQLEPDLAAPDSLLAPVEDGVSHVAWVQGLSDGAVEAGTTWLRAVSDAVGP